MPSILDLRTQQHNPPEVEGKHQLSQGRVVVRHPSRITGIVLHQTACVFGPLDRPSIRHRRALRLGAHAVAFNDGVVALGNPLTWYVWHANRLNASTLGLEIEGHFAGAPDNPDTPRREDEESTWGTTEPTPVTQLLLDTARLALSELVRLGREAGCPIQYLYAHRQASKTRRSDPGWELWRAVALDFGVVELGLETVPGLTVGSGKPIPREWDPIDGVGSY